MPRWTERELRRAGPLQERGVTVLDVRIEPLSIDGAWSVTPQQRTDDRGTFLEAFRADALAGVVGRRPEVAQVNCSVSAAGVIRGVHFADVPPGQAKYVTCPVGAVLDVVVDVRVGSPTYGGWDAVLLDDVDRRAVYLAEGLGHAFCSLTDGSTVVYLCSTGYDPAAEHGVHPLDPDLGIPWPRTGRDGRELVWRLSAKDEEAPTLDEARASAVLPVALPAVDPA